jgi:hypothetical protein
MNMKNRIEMHPYKENEEAKQTEGILQTEPLNRLSKHFARKLLAEFEPELIASINQMLQDVGEIEGEEECVS